MPRRPNRPGSSVTKPRNYQGNRFAHLMASKKKPAGKRKAPPKAPPPGKKKAPPVPPVAQGLAQAMASAGNRELSRG